MQQLTISQFVHIIWEFYQTNKRIFPWRNVPSPYQVLVSEIMLQQTQTERITQRYEQFLSRFPTLESLAQASLHDVLHEWQGLGYNRRGKYLHQTALHIYQNHQGIVPDDSNILVTFPGIGPGTAGSIPAFAYNRPTVFIETNIRAVFIHHFFSHTTHIRDAELIPLIAASVCQINPREWYYALMDYGVMLKKSGINPCRKSAHHAKQSKFEGSDRQLRGKIIKQLLQHPASILELSLYLQEETVRITRIVQGLYKEKLITEHDALFKIAEQ